MLTGMHFQHPPAIWNDNPELAAGALLATGIAATAPVDERTARFLAIAENRLAASTESDLPEIQAWRRTFRGWARNPPSTGAPPSRCCAGPAKSGRYRGSIRRSTSATH